MKFIPKEELEMWKGLVSGEATSIRTAYCNSKYIGGKPVVICTNNKNLLKLLMTHEYFKYDCYFYEARGLELIPPGVIRGNREIKVDITEHTSK